MTLTSKVIWTYVIHLAIASFVIEGRIDLVGDGSGYGAKGKIVLHQEQAIVFTQNNVGRTNQNQVIFSIASLTLL